MGIHQLELPLAMDIVTKHCLDMRHKPVITHHDVELFLAMTTLVLFARDNNVNGLIDLSLDAHQETEALLNRLTKGTTS